MSKKSISELKEYFQAGKRPTESQFGDFIDSYAHLDNPNVFSPYYKEKSNLRFTFPNQQNDQAIDILLGNEHIYGWLEVEIVGFFNYQNSVGTIKKQIILGAFPNNTIWYYPVSRVIEASGETADNIYVGDIVWDNSINQYKITIYHTNSNGNDYAVRLVHHSTSDSIAHKAILSDVYTNPLAGQRKHYVHYNGSLGVGIADPQGKLHVGDNTKAGVVLDNRVLNIQSKIPAQIYWSESTSTRIAGDLVIAPRTDISANIAFYTNNGSGVDERMKISGNGNVGIGSENPTEKLEVNGGIKTSVAGNEGGFIELENPAKVGAQVRKWRIYNMTGGYGNGLQFWSYSPNGDYGKRLWLSDSGNMALYGKLEAKDVIITPTPTADFVFSPDYNLRDLQNLEAFISEKNHLPEIPSAHEMEEKGLAVGDFQIKLLQKIEELTLYMISLKKEIDILKLN